MIGESGYVTDIAVEVYDDDSAYLWGRTTVYDEMPYGTTYVERRADGFYVKLAKHATYTPRNHKRKQTDNRYEIVAWLE